jgi:hypothetical protein
VHNQIRTRHSCSTARCWEDQLAALVQETSAARPGWIALRSTVGTKRNILNCTPKLHKTVPMSSPRRQRPFGRGVQIDQNLRRWIGEVAETHPSKRGGPSGGVAAPQLPAQGSAGVKKTHGRHQMRMVATQRCQVHLAAHSTDRQHGTMALLEQNQ